MKPRGGPSKALLLVPTRKAEGMLDITEGERAVLGPLVKGYSREEISAMLGLSKATVHGRLYAAQRRISARTIYHLVGLYVDEEHPYDFSSREMNRE